MVRNNKEIYGEVSGGVTYGVSIDDVKKVLGSTSNDVATLCEAANINPWARYRPIATAVLDSRNIPSPLTDEDREALSWGYELFWDPHSSGTGSTLPAAACQVLNAAIESLSDPAAIEAAEDAVIGQLSVKPREWESGVYHRLSDFLCYDDLRDGLATVNGYKHDAAPTTLTWHDASAPTSEKTMSGPLLEAANRDLYIEDDATMEIPIPNDALYLDGILGTLQNTWASTTVVKTIADPRSLSPIELLINADKDVSSTGLPSSYQSLDGSCPRGVYILVKNPRETSAGPWMSFGWFQGAYNHGSSGFSGRNYIWTNATPIDLQSTDASIAGIVDTYSNGRYNIQGYVGNVNDIYAVYSNDTFEGYSNYLSIQGKDVVRATWKHLQGKCLFIEYYYNGTNPLPIPGYAYFVNIHRVASGYGGGDVDIPGSVYLVIGEQSDNQGAAVYVCSDTPPTTLAEAQALLNAHFTALNVFVSTDETEAGKVSGMELNLLQSSTWNWETSSIICTDSVNRSGVVLSSAYTSSYTGSGTYYIILKAVKVGGATAYRVAERTAS